MGIFGKLKEFSENRKYKKIQKAAKIVKNSKAIREDRWAALTYFAEDCDELNEAVPALLARFDYSLEHGINDTREKELAMKGILRFENEAIPILRDWLKATNRIAWPIKVLKSLNIEAELVESLKAALRFEDVSFDQSAIDKNYDILCYLVDYQLPGFLDSLNHFLRDPDERVRFAAAEVLLEQEDPKIPEIMEPFLADESAENLRIRQSVIEAFVKNSWRLKTPEKFEDSKVTEGVFITRNKTLHRA